MKIDIIGEGNVGTHLFKAFKECANVVLVNSRTFLDFRNDSQIYIICVKDDVVADIAQKIAPLIPSDAVLCHTSGSLDIDILNGIHKHIGVLYPLQTFSKDVEIDYQNIPFFLEANDLLTKNNLEKTVKLVNERYYFISSEARRKLHIASVFSCNFVNHLWALSEIYLNEADLSFNFLMPLIQETVRKIEKKSPFELQTGPAIRYDKKIINKHLDCLSYNQNMKKLYEDLTNSIITLYRNN